MHIVADTTTVKRVRRAREKKEDIHNNMTLLEN